MARLDTLPSRTRLSVCGFLMLRSLCREAEDPIEKVRWEEMAQAKKIQIRGLRG